MEKEEFKKTFTDLIDNLEDKGVLIISKTNDVNEELDKLYLLCEARTK